MADSLGLPGGVLAEAMVRLTVDSGEYEQELADAEKRFESHTRIMEKIGSRIRLVGAAMFTAGSAAFLGLSNLAHDYAGSIDRVREELVQLGRETERSVKDFEAQARIWEQQGKAIDDTVGAYRALAETSRTHAQTMLAVQAAVELSSAKEIELSASVEMVNQALDGQYKGLATVMPELENVAGGVDILTLILTKYGGTAERTADSTVRMNALLMQASRDLGSVMLPTFERLVAVSSNLARWFSNLSEGQRKFAGDTIIATAAVGGLLMVGGQLIVVFTRLRALIVAIRGVQFASVIGGWSKAMLAFATGPVGIAIAALGTLIALLYQAEAAQRNLMQAMGEPARGGGRRMMNSGYVETAEGELETPQEMMEENQPSIWERGTQWLFFPKSYYEESARRVQARETYEESSENLRRWRERAESARKSDAAGNFQPMPSGSPFYSETPSHYETVAAQLAGQTGLR